MRWKPTRTDWSVAGACGAWALTFNAYQGQAFIVLGILTVPATLPLRRNPTLAATAVLALSVFTWALDAAAGLAQSPSVLAPSMICLYALGRYASMPQALIGLVAFDVVTGGWAGWTVPNLAFALLCLGGPLVFGRLVRRRTEGAQIAEQMLADQARLDPAALAAAVVATERGRLATEAVGVVRTAVLSMRGAADLAADDLDAEALTAIQDAGRSAIAELRLLLGLLRRDEPGPSTVADRSGRRNPLADMITATGLAAASLAEAALDGVEPAKGSVMLVVLLAATVAFRRVHPTLACVAATAVYATSILLHVPLHAGIGGGVVTVLLAWSVATNGSRSGWTALGFLLFADTVQTHILAPGTETISVVALLLGAVCGFLWAERSRVEQAALRQAAVLRAASDEQVETARRNERLRVARELHDVTSHAVGVMVLQAGAAQALRGRDAAAARAAVAEIEKAGEAALSELGMLAELLEPKSDRIDGCDDLPGMAALLALIDRVRAGGVTVTVTLQDLVAADPEVRSAVHRIVQEALTNVLRHAPGSTVRVSVLIDDCPDGYAVDVLVQDSGSHRPAPATESGFGLVGLAERVRALGGDLAVGRHRDGGFAVHARMPMQGRRQRTGDCTLPVRRATR